MALYNSNEDQPYQTTTYLPLYQHDLEAENGRNKKWKLLFKKKQYNSPPISTSTTATNLSSMDDIIGGIAGKKTKKCALREENMKQEFHPLQHRKDGLETEVETKKESKIFIQVITAISVSLVSLVIGFVSAYTSPAAESLKEELQISDNEYSWVCSLMPLSALVGGFIGGPLIDFIGRKWTIAFTDILYILSWFLCANASNIWFVYAARSIVGFSVGIASLVLPVYLGETIQPEIRGTLGLLPAAFGNTGILVCFVAGSYLKWDHLAWLGFALPFPFLVLLCIIPESPRWYISKSKDEKAKETLKYLRGKGTDIREEFEDLKNANTEMEKASSSTLFDLFQRDNVKALMISLGLMFFQQLSGINAVIFYTTTIFKMAGSTIDENLCTIIVGLVNFASTFIATLLIDRLGRKVLLYISSISMIVTLSVLGAYFYLLNAAVDVSEYGWLPLISFVVYVLGFSLGFGPIPWLMLGEILPAKIRGSAASIATAFNWACTFIVTKSFVDIIELVGPHGTFWLFAMFVSISVIFIYIWVPETRGKSLEDIERFMKNMKEKGTMVNNMQKEMRRMSSLANLKPLPSTSC